MNTRFVTTRVSRKKELAYHYDSELEKREFSGWLRTEGNDDKDGVPDWPGRFVPGTGNDCLFKSAPGGIGIVF